MSTGCEFAISEVKAGRLNALVKNLMRVTGISDPEEVIRSINADEWTLTRKFVGGLSAPSDPIIVGPLPKTFKPELFFRDDNPGVKLFVYSCFKNSVLSFARPVSEKAAASVVFRDLKKSMNDTKIRTELGEGHVFQLDDLWVIAELIERQAKGGSCALLNGSANLFYLQVGASVFAVCVRRRGSFWHVFGWNLDGYSLWSVGSRVLFRNG